jgi:hypothetical protein
MTEQIGMSDGAMMSKTVHIEGGWIVSTGPHGEFRVEFDGKPIATINVNNIPKGTGKALKSFSEIVHKLERLSIEDRVETIKRAMEAVGTDLN